VASASQYDTGRTATYRQAVGDADLRTRCRPAVRCVGFWTAVLAPFVLLTLLATGVLVEHPLVAGGLFGANLVGLVVGHEYRSDAHTVGASS